MTSLVDSFGIVLIEAMARGLPVIAPNISACGTWSSTGSTACWWNTPSSPCEPRAHASSSSPAYTSTWSPGP